MTDKWQLILFNTILRSSMKGASLFIRIFCLVFLLGLGQVAFAQARKDSLIIVKHVLLQGNHRTRDRIVTRELDYKMGDTIHLADTHTVFRRINEKLYNQRLFNKTNISLTNQIPAKKDSLRKADILLKVKERWYTFAVPLVELADRSFNEWYYNHNANISRINYGIRIVQNNTTGNNDPLKVGFQWGFTRRTDLSYKFPYLDKKQKGGLIINASYSTNVSAAASSIDNKQIFIDYNLKTVRVRRVLGLAYTRREGFYTYWEAGLSYNHNSIADTIAKVNPDYYGQGRRDQHYLQARLSYSYDRRDYQRFATRGYNIIAELEQNGLLLNRDLFQTSFRFRINKYFKLNDRLFYATGADALIAFQDYMPYANLYGIGYNLRFVRGYDAQVVEAPQSFIWKNSLRFKFFDRVFHNGLSPLEQFKTVPIKLYLKAFADAGYARNVLVTESNKPLTNRILPGYGLGLDVVSFYDVVLRFEYSFNYKAQRGFYFYLGVDI